jgi:hypothetical protein
VGVTDFLFEVNVRSFVLSELQWAISHGLSDDCLCASFLEMSRAFPLPSEMHFVLESDFFKSVNFTANFSRFSSLCELVSEQFPHFDDSESSRFLFFEIIRFLSQVSPLREFPQTTFPRLELALAKFTKLTPCEYRSLFL